MFSIIYIKNEENERRRLVYNDGENAVIAEADMKKYENGEEKNEVVLFMYEEEN